MAEFRLDDSLSADEYLELVTAVNKRRNRGNAMLRGIGAIAQVTPTERTSSGFDTSLRAYSKAKDEEILASIIGHGADHNFIKDDMFNENLFRDWYAIKGLPDKFYEKAVAEFRKRAGRYESRLASEASQATADYQKKIRPGQIKRQEQEISSADKEADKKLHEKYAEDQASEIAMNAYDYVKQGMDPEIALETATEQARSKFKRGDITGGYDSPWARSAYVKAREKFNKLVKSKETPVQVYDTRKGQLEFMTPTEIEAINKDASSTILPPGERPADVTPTGDMKSQLERRGLVEPVSEALFSEMTPEDQAQTRQNYLSLTQLVRSGQRQNVLLQGLTEGPMAKNTYDQINMIVEIEDPQFFQRVFEVANPYELYAKFQELTKGMKPDAKANAEKQFVANAALVSGWEPDHIYSMIRPEKYGVGVKYSRYRVGG